MTRRVLAARDHVVCVAGALEHALWRAAADAGWCVRAQPTDHLGENLRDAVAGYRSVVVLGTDSPDLPDALLDAAVDALATHDVVLGPSFDGGYYLVGFREGHGRLFDDIDWGTDRVLAQTLERVSGRSVALLPYWYDLDDVADLRRVVLNSAYGVAPGGQTPRPTPHLHRFLDALDL